MIKRHCSIHALTPADDGWHYWFGYYDKCPWSSDGSKLLCHRARFADRFPEVGETCEVGFIALDDPKRPFVKLGETLAWNWQQGSMLQWFGDDAVLFNDRVNGKPGGELIARIVPLDGGVERHVAGPVLAMSPDRRFALSLGMGRVNAVRFEYGYPGETDPNPTDPAPEDDGVFRIDMESGERELILPLSAMKLSGSPERSDAEPFGYANHLMFNRSGSRFCFVHRYERDDGIVQTRLFTANADGSGLRLVMSGMVSHYDWRDDETILAWAGFRKLLAGGEGSSSSPKARVMTLARRTLKPVYYALGKPRFLMNRIVKDAYMLIPDVERADQKGLIETWAKGELICDGHCTFNRGGAEPGRWVVTDGYPDRGKQPLFLWDTSEDVGYELGRYRSPAEFDNEIRVDLHPRFDRDTTRVCVDSALSGARRIYEVDIRGITSGSAADEERRAG